MDPSQLAETTRRLNLIRDALAGAQNDLIEAARSITDAVFDPEDDSPQDRAAEVKAGADAIADELSPLIALLDTLRSMDAQPTERADVADGGLPN